MAIILPLTPPFFIGEYWDNSKFLLIALVPVMSFGYLVFTRKQLPFLPKIDIPLFLFVAFCFLSYTWAINGSLVWYPSFSWLVMLLWMFLFRYIAQQTAISKPIHSIMLILFGAVFLHIAVVFFDGQLISLERWNSHFGYNANYTSTYFLAILPFALFYPLKKIWWKIFLLIATAFVVFILYKASSRGAMIAFGIVMLYYLRNLISDKLFKPFAIISALLMIVGFVFGSTYIINLIQSGDVGESHRLYMLKSSLQIFQENPLNGIGLSNWYLLAYREDLVDVAGFNQSLYFSRLGSHNLYEQIITELGIIGLLLFLIPFVVISWRGWVESNKLNHLQKAAFASLMVYLVSSFVYKDANAYEAHLSTLQLLGFINVGILTSNNKTSLSLMRLGTVTLMALALMGVLWFSYFFKVSKTYNEARPNFNWPYELELVDQNAYNNYFELDYYKNIEETIELIEKIFHPVFKTTHGFYAGRRGANRPLALHLALLYQKKGNIEQADDYFQLALSKGPYDEEALRKYARFLLRAKKEGGKAKIYAERAYAIQSNNINTNLLMAEIAIYSKEWTSAKKYLETVDNASPYYYVDIKELLLIEIDIKEGQLEKAAQGLKALKRSATKKYGEQINILKQQLEQASKNTVKE